ncbi:PAS domain-containing protein [Tsuneonella troitsensis]|uniref:PAS domain-containing protein n=1 Tax=Tsuneonella troitsensis TaxID=292222 RepID=UPI00070B443A
MDNLRGYIGAVDYDADSYDHGIGDDDSGRELPPSPIGQDERRMQVRAYNHWACLLADRNFPSIEDLDPDALPDFGPYSVLLDFTNGIDNPSVRFLGTMLAQECDVTGVVDRLSDVPSRSLLTRITDHYMQILANQAPIGFEAEFVNQRGQTILYRGILLPFSSDDDTIDFIYGVINWKEMADQLTSDELLLEIDQALEIEDGRPRPADPVTDWADGPGVVEPLFAAATTPVSFAEGDDPFPLPAFGESEDTGSNAYRFADHGEHEDEDEEAEETSLYESIEAVDEEPEGPSRFASLLTLGGGRSNADAFDEDEDFDEDDDEDPVAKWLKRPTPLDSLPDVDFAPLAPVDTPHDLDAPFEAEPVVDQPAAANDYAPFELTEAIEHDDVFAQSAPEPEAVVTAEPVVADDETVIDLDDFEVVEAADEATGLYDCLAAAREMAIAARSCEDRSRTALYAAVGRAYDFSIAAQAEPEEFAELMADSGLTMQDRAPMTPVVKLVFGADYDKTRLTEYAAVLTHAHRMGIERGTLAGYLGAAEGGLKGIVHAERAYRRSDDGEVPVRETPREALARKLRAIAPLGFEDIEADGEEFALVMIRRVDGEVVVLGEVVDTALVEKAAKKLVA